MNPDFSEFSYGYAVTEEIVTAEKAAVLGAPRFPSLYEEGKKGGYDVKIPLSGRPVFLQFKLSDYLHKNNAREHRDGLLNTPYYRMHLRPTRHSEQHDLLLALENSGESVFYIAPEFHQPAELNDFYLRKVVVKNSAAFSPRDIGPLPDDGEHYVVFHRGSRHGYLCSEKPVEIKKSSLKNGLPTLLDSRDVQRRDLGGAGLRRMVDRMFSVLRDGEFRQILRQKSWDIEGIKRIIDERPAKDSIGYMARTFFDAELLILPI